MKLFQEDILAINMCILYTLIVIGISIICLHKNQQKNKIKDRQHMLHHTRTFLPSIWIYTETTFQYK